MLSENINLLELWFKTAKMSFYMVNMFGEIFLKNEPEVNKVCDLCMNH